jgi:hypothetical protein
MKRLGVKRKRPQGSFPSNELVTARYNVVSFLPVNLYQQFKRIANLYFLGLVCLQVRWSVWGVGGWALGGWRGGVGGWGAGGWGGSASTSPGPSFAYILKTRPRLIARRPQAIPGLSPVPWWGTLFPLAVVLTVNGVKEAFDDYWRHASDAQVNRRCVDGVVVSLCDRRWGASGSWVSVCVQEASCGTSMPRFTCVCIQPTNQPTIHPTCQLLAHVTSVVTMLREDGDTAIHWHTVQVSG